MPHLLTPRTGWQNEHLGLFILSKFAFCANPVTVSDDLGSDFFCCLFDIRTRKGHRIVVPLNSFAIQIKSSPGPIDVSNKIQYLSELEIPFFIGVVTQKRLTLTIYSGEYLPMLFPEVGLPERLRIVPVNHRVTVSRYYEKRGRGHFQISFPRVATVTARRPQSELRRVVQQLQNLCRRIHGNIATRRGEEHIYSVPSRRRYHMMAGPGSVKVFRENLNKRLAEAFFNFEWLLQRGPSGFDATEARLHLDFAARLRRHHGSLPTYVTRSERRLRRMMQERGV